MGECNSYSSRPAGIWKTPKKHPAWRRADAVYHRSSSGGGNWEIKNKIPSFWSIGYGDLSFNVKTMGFKHTGIFPEQAVNWDYTAKLIKNAGRPVKVLNLFAYTGGATVACLKAGAEVVHVDASKGMVQWAKENAVASGVADRKVRWIVDDCVKFVQRETRRGNKYDIIIMDLRHTAEDRAERFGSLKTKFIRLLSCAHRSCRTILLWCLSIHILRDFLLRLCSIF